MGRKRKKPGCESAFKPARPRPQRLRDSRTITRYAPERQREVWLCASNYTDEEGFLTCEQAKRRGLCKGFSPASEEPPEIEALRTPTNASSEAA